MEALAKAATALAEAAEATATKTKPSGWIAIVALTIVANTLITIYLYPSQRPDYWWLPGAWIVFLIYDYIWRPFRNWLYSYTDDPDSKDPNKRRKFFAPPRIA